MRARKPLLQLFTLASLVSIAGCVAVPVASPGGCDIKEKALKGDRLTATDQAFLFGTPSAKNDCHAEYILLFRWANDERAEKDSNRPPLRDLRQSFGPEDEFSYFPHPTEVRKVILGKHHWLINFSVGNKNTNLSNTRYGFGTALDPDTFKPGDSVAISMEITYTPY